MTIRKPAILAILSTLTLAAWAGLTVPATATAVDECRARSGLVGSAQVDFGAAMAMHECVSGHIRVLDGERRKPLAAFHDRRRAFDTRLTAGGGQLRADTCDQEMAQRRWVEDALGEIGTLRTRHAEAVGAIEDLYEAYGAELSLLYAGGAATETLARLIRLMNADLAKLRETADRDQRAMRNFYVDLQAVSFEDACGRPGASGGSAGFGSGDAGGHPHPHPGPRSDPGGAGPARDNPPAGGGSGWQPVQ